MIKKKMAEERVENRMGWKKWLPEAEAAVYLSIAPVTLRKWREQGRTSKGEKPPRCFKRGVNYYYSIRILDEWIENGIEINAEACA